jgi:hypothetical protein
VPTMRDSASLKPPGGKGDSKRIGRMGYSCATAPPHTAAETMAASKMIGFIGLSVNFDYDLAV